ncbi:MAG: glycosyltransferase family 2 protein [Nitrososphaerota archaeon]|nr:glycosyltransferase family 2 protein [Nitrososphaerota archaeon]
MLTERDTEKRLRISVIVATLAARPEILSQCIGGVLEQSYKPIELIIVNDGPHNILTEILDSFSFPRETAIRVVNNTRRMGPAEARNQGLEIANGDIVAFIDDDAIPDVNWLVFLVEAYKSKKVGGVCGKVLYPNSKGTEDARRITWYFDVLYDRSPVICSTDLMRGVNMSYRRDVIRRAGGFLRSLGVYSFSEDVELSLKVRDLGYLLLYQPLSAVIHFDLPYGGVKPNFLPRAYYFTRNRVLVMLEHPRFFKLPKSIAGFFLFSSRKAVRDCVRNNAKAKVVLAIVFVTRGTLEAFALSFKSRLRRNHRS